MSRYGFIAVYIMPSRRNGTLYTGVTGELDQRYFQHRNGVVDGFTRRYGCKLLVWFERHATMAAAIQREKSIKRWPRKWKLALIEAENPEWRNLGEEWVLDHRL